MKLDDKGYKEIIKSEGFISNPYYATELEKSKNIVTIGYGNTKYPDGKSVKITDKAVTKEQAFVLFKIVADDFASKVNQLITSNINQNQFNALCSLAYNIGINAFSKSTVLRLVNLNPKDLNIKKAFLMWTKQGGVELLGLKNRRIREWDIYSSI